MIKNLLLVLGLIFTLTIGNAQRVCGSMEVLQEQLQKDPKRLSKMEAIEKATQKFVNNPKKAVTGVVTIPVVVHVVYNGSTQNISDAQIATQIQVLNDDFRRLNSDANGTWPQAADTEIEFCMATVDPSGNPTTGITRKSTTVTAFGTNDAVKSTSTGGVNAWPAASYLNIWVCNIGGGILGYAQFPGGPASTDGVVCGYQYFGTIGTATAPFDLGRTMTHEVGHYLNLRHIWGDGGCNVDDFVTDTPTSDAPNYGCATGHVSCSTVDMVQNYMDYSDDACMNLYTTGQKTRMRAIFDTNGARASLLTSTACGTPATPTCSDGIQNQGETGIDCGGPNCAPCNTNCTNVVVTITFDNYPEETAWNIKNSSGVTVASGGTYGSQPDGSTLSITNCLVDGCYDFTITDTYGDGICCAYGNGSYNVTVNGTSVASGGSFGTSQTTNFCLGGSPAPTCSDGIQNQGETGVDCGGPNCAPCNAGGCTDVQINFNNFDSGWGLWVDGGTDCARVNSSAYSNSGTYSIRIRDNTSSSVMTTQTFNLDGYEEVTVSWSYLPVGMETGEDFWLQVSTNGGSSYQTITTYASGTDFVNNVRENESVTMIGTFTSSTRFRFRCDASADSDAIYIDDVNIEGCVNSNRQISETIDVVEDEGIDENISDVHVYPNPAYADINVEFNSKVANLASIRILNMNGQIIKDYQAELQSGKDVQKMNIEDFNAGVYYMHITQGDQRIVKKFIVIK